MIGVTVEMLYPNHRLPSREEVARPLLGELDPELCCEHTVNAGQYSLLGPWSGTVEAFSLLMDFSEHSTPDWASAEADGVADTYRIPGVLAVRNTAVV